MWSDASRAPHHAGRSSIPDLALGMAASLIPLKLPETSPQSFCARHLPTTPPVETCWSRIAIAPQSSSSPYFAIADASPVGAPVPTALKARST